MKIFGDSVYTKFEKWKKHEKVPRSKVEAVKTCGFILGIPCQT